MKSDSESFEEALKNNNIQAKEWGQVLPPKHPQRIALELMDHKIKCFPTLLAALQACADVLEAIYGRDSMGASLDRVANASSQARAAIAAATTPTNSD